jgi:hypothetical protein
MLEALKCIFFLTFKWTDSIYESRCDFSKSQIRNGESIDEERNQESCCKEKGRSEEKEVVLSHPISDANVSAMRGPGNGAFFISSLSQLHSRPLESLRFRNRTTSQPWTNV